MVSQPPLALVTGGHRRLGARIAGALAEAGYALAIHGSHTASPDSALAAVLDEYGSDYRCIAADFGDPTGPDRLFAAVVDSFGRAPDLLVNSASIFGQDRLSDVQPDDLARHFAVNVSAPAMLTKAFSAAVAVHVARGGAPRDWSIVNILDQRLSHPHADQFAYTLSKFALDGLTRTSARVLAPHVRVNAVAPGLSIVTDDYEDGQAEQLAAMMPLGRLPQPDDVAAAVLYLARARATTGQVVAVDGGAGMVSFDRDFMAMARV